MAESDAVNKELAAWLRTVAATQADGGHDSLRFEMIAQRLESLSQVSEEEVEAAAQKFYEFEESPDDIVPWKIQRITPLGRHYLDCARATLKAARKAKP